MAIFKKKDKKEEETFSKRQNSKSLQSARKKKKDSPGPWTRKERLLVTYFFIGTIVLSGVLALSARSWKLPNFPRIRLPSFEVFKGGIITIEGNRPTGANQQKADNVVSAFKDKTKGLSGIYGLYVLDLNDNFDYGVNEKETFQAASLIKLPVMAAMYMEDAKGDIDLEEEYSLKSSDKVSGAGSLQYKDEGYEITYRELIELMGQESDNTAFGIVRSLLGDQKIQKTMDEIGMTRSDLVSNETTPKDIGLFFEKLWKGDLISSESRDELLGFLTDTTFEEWLAAGIPKDVQVAHKFGRETNVVNDAGVVFSDKPFVLVIMSKGVIGREADETFLDLAEIVYKVESQ